MNTAKKQVGPGNRTVRRAAPSTVVDKEIALSQGVFQKNAAFVKSQDGKPVKLSDTTMYIAVDAAKMSSKVSILNSNTKKLVGITNLDGDRLNTGRNAVISAVRILYSTDGTSLADADWQNQDRLPSSLQNAEITIMQANQRILAMPLTDLQGFLFEDWRKLSDRPFLRSNEPIAIELEFPIGVTVPEATAAVKQFLRFEFRVTESRA